MIPWGGKMRLNHLLVSLISFSLMGPMAYGSGETEGKKTAESLSDFEAVPGEFVIQFKEGAEVQSFGYDIKNKREKVLVVRASILMQSDFVLEDLKTYSEVKYAEPNYIYKINRIPNDEYLKYSWGLVNFGQKIAQKGLDGIRGVDIGAEKAWNIQTGSPEIVIAIVDTGLNFSSEDLRGNLWVNEGEIPNNGLDDDGNGFVDDIHGYDFANNDGDSKDDNGHGSMCASVIGAKGGDGVGLVGVAWDVRMMSLKYADFLGRGTTARVVMAIDYAIEMGADIISNSWGGSSYSDILKEAIERAHAKGVLFVASAGNVGQNNDVTSHYPSNYEVPNVISVGAMTNRGKLWSDSNFGVETVDITAPGEHVVGKTLAGVLKLNSGTSFAVPYVSGVAALLLSNERDLTPEQIIERLKRTSRPFSVLKGRIASGGMVNAYQALINEAYPPTEKSVE